MTSPVDEFNNIHLERKNKKFEYSRAAVIPLMRPLSHREFLNTANPLLYPTGAYSFQARLRGGAEQRKGELI